MLSLLTIQEPAIISDRYARLNHGYTGTLCSSIDSDLIPNACTLGSADAQNAASIASFVQFAFTFVTSPLVGSLSDRYGRKREYSFFSIHRG